MLARLVMPMTLLCVSWMMIRNRCSSWLKTSSSVIIRGWMWCRWTECGRVDNLHLRLTLSQLLVDSRVLSVGPRQFWCPSSRCWPWVLVEGGLGIEILKDRVDPLGVDQQG